MDPARRYAPSRRALHWLMFIGVVLAFVSIEGREWFERGTPARMAMVQAHFWVGITLLMLFVLKMPRQLKIPHNIEILLSSSFRLDSCAFPTMREI